MDMAGEKVTIRPYESKDAREIVRLFYETVRSVNRTDYSQEQVEAWAPEIPDPEAWNVRLTSRRTLVAEVDGEVVGFAELEDDGHLDMFYCHRDFVGRGLGSKLYRAVEQQALTLGISRVFTEASTTARPFFERQGFRVIREQTVTRRGVELMNFVMDKSLDPPGS